MLLIHSVATPGEYIKRIGSLLSGRTLLPMPASRAVYRSISSHPDIFLFQAQADVIIYSPKLPSDFLRALSADGIQLISADAGPSGAYPGTAGLNALRVGGHIIHNSRATDPAIKDYARLRGIKLSHCSQGYARCSSIPLGENAVITQDESVAKACTRLGIDTLKVRPFNILLPGERYGFIGGASGILRNGDVVFLGEIKKYPNFIKIGDFIQKHSRRYFDLPDLPLFDSGTLIVTG